MVLPREEEEGAREGGEEEERVVLPVEGSMS